MTPEQINVAIAEWMGWERIIFRGTFHPKHLDYVGTHDSCRPDGATGRWQGTIPNYYGDLNAIHEAALSLGQDKGTIYCMELRRIVMRDRTEAMMNEYGTVSDLYFYEATAPQRCEALLITIEKLEESKP